MDFRRRDERAIDPQHGAEQGHGRQGQQDLHHREQHAERIVEQLQRRADDAQPHERLVDHAVVAQQDQPGETPHDDVDPVRNKDEDQDQCAHLAAADRERVGERIGQEKREDGGDACGLDRRHHDLGEQRGGEKNAIGLEREPFARKAAPAHQDERSQEEEGDPGQARQEQQRRQQPSSGRQDRPQQRRCSWLGQSSHRTSSSPVSLIRSATGNSLTALDRHVRKTLSPRSIPAPRSRATLTFSTSVPTATSSLKVSP